MTHQRSSVSVSLKIRPMDPADLDQVVAIEESSFSHPWSREQFQSELARAPISRCYVAQVVESQEGARQEAQDSHDPSPLAGFLTSWLVTDEMHITNVAVSPEQRGKGVAKTFLEHVLAEIVSAGGKWCQLEVRAGNTAAKGLYLKLGFQNLGVRRGYYGDGEDAIVMGKELDR